MQIMYVDESGDDGQPKHGSGKNGGPSNVFVRAGLIIHDWKWRSIYNEILEFKKANKIPHDVELHATAIIRGVKREYIPGKNKKKDVPNWYGLNLPNIKDRAALLERICEFISKKDEITLICVVIDKSKVGFSHPDSRSVIKNNSWEYLIERYNLYFKDNADKVGIIIADAVEDSLDKTHREFAKAIYEQSIHVDENHFIESILFEPSESSLLLQLADVASYSFFRKYNYHDDRLYKYTTKRLFESKGKVDGCGLKIWPK